MACLSGLSRHVSDCRGETQDWLPSAGFPVVLTHENPFYPHHMDAEWCKTQPFQQRIAHGTLIFSVAVGMTAGNVNSEAFSYGYDRLRFVKPVFIGDTLTATVTVKEKRDSPKSAAHGIVVELCQVFNQRQEAVLACEHLLMVNRRPHGENS